MKLNIKKLSEKAVMPVKAHNTDAGFDLTAISITTEINECGQLIIVYHSGIAVDIPEGYVGLLFSRSSIAKKSIIQTNCVGVIDAGYHGEIMAKFKTTTDVVPAVYKEGDKFAQLVIVPLAQIDLEEVDELPDSERNDGGYGSSDKASNVEAPAETTTEEQK